jgi:flagellar biosynthesis/type III secretory pathway M-ring protein FliF/YscJ
MEVVRMAALIIGILFMAFAVFACFPPLSWWADILAFLRGSLPVLALFVGLIAAFIGIADIKDRIEGKKEEEEEKKEEEAQKTEKTEEVK